MTKMTKPGRPPECFSGALDGVGVGVVEIVEFCWSCRRMRVGKAGILVVSLTGAYWRLG